MNNQATQKTRNGQSKECLLLHFNSTEKNMALLPQRAPHRSDKFFGTDERPSVE